MGFLDSQERIIDMVLTSEGRRQYSLGELKFVYYSFSDDGVDYNPIISEGDYLTDDVLAETRTRQTEAFIGLEALAGLSFQKIDSEVDKININKRLFTMTQGQRYLPQASFEIITSGSIQVDQHKMEIISGRKGQQGKTDNGFLRSKTSAFTLDLGISDYFPEYMQSGFAVKVLNSGTEGLANQQMKRDGNETSCFGPELKMISDGEFRSMWPKNEGKEEQTKQPAWTPWRVPRVPSRTVRKREVTTVVEYPDYLWEWLT